MKARTILLLAIVGALLGLALHEPEPCATDDECGCTIDCLE